MGLTVAAVARFRARRSPYGTDLPTLGQCDQWPDLGYSHTDNDVASYKCEESRLTLRNDLIPASHPPGGSRGPAGASGGRQVGGASPWPQAARGSPMSGVRGVGR